METRARNIEESYQVMFERYPGLRPWVDSLRTAGALHDITIRNIKGIQTHGLYIPAAKKTDKTAVVIHSWAQNAVRMLHIAYLYNHDLGYNVLLPDLHGHGENRPGSARMGWLDRLDVIEWIKEANKLFKSDYYDTQIVVHGISMGAATTMMVAGEIGYGLHELPYVKCYVEDCGYTSVRELFNYLITHYLSIPTFPLIDCANELCNALYGWNFDEASAIESVKRSTRPMLYIHSEGDDVVPVHMAYELYEANPNPKEIWITKATRHSHSYMQYPAEYTQHVKEFVEKYISDTIYDE